MPDGTTVAAVADLLPSFWLVGMSCSPATPGVRTGCPTVGAPGRRGGCCCDRRSDAGRRGAAGATAGGAVRAGFGSVRYFPPIIVVTNSASLPASLPPNNSEKSNDPNGPHRTSLTDTPSSSTRTRNANGASTNAEANSSTSPASSPPSPPSSTLVNTP
ncbi:hypothetical protein J0H58_23800 [bacterium]|nr:hypothetical protein [bacterium]